MSAQPLANSQPPTVTLFSAQQLQASAIVMDADNDSFSYMASIACFLYIFGLFFSY